MTTNDSSSTPSEHSDPPRGATGEGGPDPAAAPPPPPGQPNGASFFDAVRRSGFFRGDERWVGGVASGLARRLGVDPLIVRAAWGVLALVAGIGLVLYAAAWALLPDERDGRIHLQDAVHGKLDGAWVGILVLGVLGFTAGSGAVGFLGAPASGIGHAIVAMSVIGLITAVIVLATRGARSGTDTAGTPGRPAATTVATTPWAAAPGASGETWAAAPQGTPPYGPPSAGSWAPQPPSGHGQRVRPAPVATAPRPAPPKQLRPIVRGPGSTAFAIVVGITLLTVAGLLVADRADVFDGSTTLAITGVVVAIAGLGVAVSGLRGRRSGAIGALAVVALVVSGPVFASTEIGRSDATYTTSFDSVSWQPSTAAAVGNGYQSTFGDATIDLRTTRLVPGETLEVPVRVFASSVVVLVPPGTPVSADLSLVGAQLNWNVDEPRTYQRLRRTTHLESQSVKDGARPLIHLDVHGAASEITVEEA